MPKLHAVFRFSTYLTLTLGTICLGLTERGQMNGALGFYSVVVLLILTAYLLEGRWVLPRLAANLLGVFILLGWVAWSGISLREVTHESTEGTVDILRVMLPRVGPLLASLLLAKLFRPKQASDWWMLHALTLIQVVLGCVLALSSRLDRENSLYAITLFLYLACAVWAMVMFYLYRESLGLKPSGGARPAAPQAVVAGRSVGVGQGLGWFATAMLLALFFFFLVPRLGHDAAGTLIVPGSARASTGFSPSVDLNNTGLLEVNEELVMRVEARDVLGKAVNLGGDLRLRGVTCSEYVEGKWRPKAQPLDIRAANYYAPTETNVSPIHVEFSIDPAKIGSGRVRLGGSQGQPVFLAEPIYINPGRNAPSVIQDPRVREINYRQLEAGLLASTGRRSRNIAYTQIYMPDPQGGATWTQRLQRGIVTFPAEGSELNDPYLKNLQELPQPLKESGLIKKEADRILAAARVDAKDSRERKARTLEHYLATSNQFGYALEWNRRDLALDPTEDFLLNVKLGHCELYASALALMLRSQGIPARVVIGFRGANWNEYTELHEIHQYHAHAWVEARIGEGSVNVSRAVGDTQHYEWKWLILDPTPAGGTAGAIGVQKGVLEDEINLLKYLWESLILDYSGDDERQQIMVRLSKLDWLKDSIEFWSELASLNRLLTILIIAAVLLFVAWAVLRHRRRQASARAQGTRVAFYARLLQLLERVSLRPGRGETAREFGHTAAEMLARRLPAHDLATLPSRIIEHFYAVRFGGRDLEPRDANEITRDLERLAQALGR
jgi:transglutaminase-like putative cysteine protease